MSAGRRPNRYAWEWWLWVAPGAVALAFVYLYPVLVLFRDSLYQITGYTSTFVGLRNYLYVLRDEQFHAAILHNVLLLLCVPILVVLSLVLAIVLYERVVGWQFYRTVLFLPYILAVPVASVVFSHLLQYGGVVNSFLRYIGLGWAAVDWLGSPKWALPTLMGIIVWKELGFGIVLFLARLLSLPQELFEAARVDGASWLQVHRYVTVPQLRDVIGFYVTVESITMLSWVFNYVYIVSNGTGGPGTSTLVTELYVYRKAFGYGAGVLGVASAASVLLFLGSILMIIWNLRRQKEALG
ncbi:sugar ABC transporter permease [Caldinitratiruptor microaerophilus]|uniref:Sugar ABC transporter permease n=1 Tax=Caldinitratiruptor microaerophilus TaxID=671077 RepID=A0AA35G7I3_9FIRM|nr:sugar ABC transporter permease [Caldinitratiruptor microaerophilus]